MKPAMSENMSIYFEKIDKEVENIYKIAKEAREKGFDPVKDVECPPAHDMAGRVENLVGPKGVGKRIRELKENGFNQDQVTFKIADEIIAGKLGKFKDDEEKVDRAIRVALAIKTEGVVSAPLEGISEIKIRQDLNGGNPYLSMYFSGPIRAAGGTVQAFCVLIADYVREKMKITRYKATEKEISRIVEEVKLYDRVVNLQYPSTKEELEYAIRNLKVELNGDPTERREVSANRNLRRIETNFIRSGPCLVLNDGVLLKSKKIMKVIENMKIPGWEWLKEVKKYSHTDDDNKKREAENQKEGEYGGGLYDGSANKVSEELHDNKKEVKTPVEIRRKKLNKRIPPIFKYIADVIGGRPVFAYPSMEGGHRIRYGRSRNTGLAACGMNPNGMYILNNFIAVGTQIKIERPGKAGSVMPVSSIEGPVCLHKNGDVIQYNEPNSYKQINEENPIKKILWIGDISFGFGEFAENNHTLLPSGYVEEWWVLELEKSSEFSEKKQKNIQFWIDNPFEKPPSGKEAIEISKTYKIPLHPHYTYHFGNINGYELLEFRNEIKNYYYKNNVKFTEYTKLRIPDTELSRNFLYKVYCPHKKNENYLELAENQTPIFIEILALDKNLSSKKSEELDFLSKKSVGLELFPLLTEILVKDKAPYYMGSRMGRPEKAKERKMKPPVNCLFPMGHDTANKREVQEALKGKGLIVDTVIRECLSCKTYSHRNICKKCGNHTEIRKYCRDCRIYFHPGEVKCSNCGRDLNSYKRRKIDFANDFNDFKNKIKIKIPSVKGVKGLSSEFKMPEPIEKGILRAKNDVWVFKDGTIRFDALDIPFTHFTPKEIGTSIDKLKELGYEKDMNGIPLEDPYQICELKVQDFIATTHCGDYFVRVANFVDDELEYIYDLPRFYNCDKREDLIGHLFAGLAPHTSAAIVGRCIGFTPITAGYGHPYWHAAKRRNCDGDEDGLLLMLDMLLNFSRFYLPAKIGGKMDAPLVLSVTLDPNEVDGEAHNVDGLAKYPLEFYERIQNYIKPGEIEKSMGLLKTRLGKPEQFEGIKFNLPTVNINFGPKISSYKTMETMDEKIESQLQLGEQIEAVNATDVARKVLQSHFTPDIMGNLRSYSTQGFRCVCGTKYRRMPLSGKCNNCGKELIKTVSKGGIIKYLPKALDLCDRYDLGHYTHQRFELIDEYVKSLTDNPKVKQVKITSFFK